MGEVKMTKIVLAALAAALLSTSAPAADLMPAKAKMAAYPFSEGSGFYGGLDVEAGVAQANVNGTTPTFTGSLVSGNLVAAGGSVGGVLGYVWGDSKNWYALQASVNWQNISASQTLAAGVAQSASVGSRWQSSQVIKFGALSSLLDLLPNLGIGFPALPSLPAAVPGISVNTTTSHPYFMAGVQEFDSSASFAGISGRVTSVAPLVGAGILNQLQDKSGKANGAVLDTYAKVVFAGRGYSFNAGNQVTGYGNLGTQYFAGFAIYY